MFTYSLAQYAFQLGYCRTMLSDIDDAQCTAQPIAGGNHPAWIMGHLCLASDQGLRLLKQPQRLPAPYASLFGRGSQPQAQRELYPAKEELLARLEEVHAAVAEAVPHAPPELLAAPNPLPVALLQQALPTVGNLLTHLLTTHEALHLGQLAMWRRAMGKAPLF